MAVGSHNSDATTGVVAPLRQKKNAGKEELANIRKMLIAKRAARDTVNGPKLENQAARKGAIDRRLLKDKSGVNIGDSGSPDDSGGGGDSGGGDSGGGGGNG